MHNLTGCSRKSSHCDNAAARELSLPKKSGTGGSLTARRYALWTTNLIVKGGDTSIPSLYPVSLVVITQGEDQFAPLFCSSATTKVIFMDLHDSRGLPILSSNWRVCIPDTGTVINIHSLTLAHEKSCREKGWTRIDDISLLSSDHAGISIHY